MPPQGKKQHEEFGALGGVFFGIRFLLLLFLQSPLRKNTLQGENHKGSTKCLFQFFFLGIPFYFFDQKIQCTKGIGSSF